MNNRHSSRLLEKYSTIFCVCIFNAVLFTLLGSLVIIHALEVKTLPTISYVKLTKVPPPIKPPAQKGGKAATTDFDPSVHVAPVSAPAPPIITATSLSSISFNSTPVTAPLPMLSVSIPQGNTLADLDSSSGPAFDASGSNPFGNLNADAGPAFTGYLYDLKRNADGSDTDIKDDGFLKDRTLEHTYEARWHWGPYIRSFLTDPNKRGQLTESVLNEAKLINGLVSGSISESRLESYYRSKPLYAYQWSIAQQSPEAIVKAFGVSGEVKPTHLLIVYHGTVVATRAGTFRFICYSRGGLIAVRLRHDLVGGCPPSWDDPLIDSRPFQFSAWDPSMVPFNETAGKWFQVSQGETLPLEILLTSGSLGVSLHLMIEEQRPAQPYLPTSLQWDTLKQRNNPRIPVRFPLFALRTGVPKAPYIAPSLNPPPDEAPADVKAEFERNGPHYQNPEVAPDPIVFPGVED